MITIVNGDLLEATEDIIVHQVNCQGAMNSGVAKLIRDKWPVVYTMYRQMWASQSDPSKLLGKAQFVSVGEEKFVANLFGQEYYGYNGKRYTSYDALYDGLTMIKKMAHLYNKSVAIPYRIGSDRGGADWNIVYCMIERIFEHYQITIYKLEEK